MCASAVLAAPLQWPRGTRLATNVFVGRRSVTPAFPVSILAAGRAKTLEFFQSSRFTPAPVGPMAMSHEALVYVLASPQSPSTPFLVVNISLL